MIANSAFDSDAARSSLRAGKAARRPSGVKGKPALTRPRGASGKGAPTSKRRPAAAKPVLLAGGNPQIAKADGDAPVRAYIAAMPGWKRGLGRRLDALIARNAPGVCRAVKWNSPFYGIEGRGWFLAFHVFTRYVKVTFFPGTALRPVPSGGTGRDARWIDIHEDDLDEAQMAAWIRQAASIRGWETGNGSSGRKT
jgi:hypothetical protein